jgi:hypothetical protein
MTVEDFALKKGKMHQKRAFSFLLGEPSSDSSPSALWKKEQTRIVKGTVRPDWICMRVISLKSPLKAHKPLKVFNFLFSLLNILKNVKVLSRFIQN